MENLDRRIVRRLAPVCLAATFVLSPLTLWAQSPSLAHLHEATSVRTYYLKNAADQREANDIMIALRNVIDPSDKIYLVNSERAIVVEAPAEQLGLVQQVLTELDRPHKVYWLTFAIHESDGGRQMPVRQIKVMAVAGQHVVVKQGNKVPVATGKFDDGSASSQTQFTYIDVGLNLDLTLEEARDGLKLSSKVEQSAVADSPVGPQDPVVRQTVLDTTADLLQGKTQMLGSLDLPDSTRHTEIEVTAEPVS